MTAEQKVEITTEEKKDAPSGKPPKRPVGRPRKNPAPSPVAPGTVPRTDVRHDETPSDHEGDPKGKAPPKVARADARPTRDARTRKRVGSAPKPAAVRTDATIDTRKPAEKGDDGPPYGLLLGLGAAVVVLLYLRSRGAQPQGAPNVPPGATGGSPIDQAWEALRSQIASMDEKLQMRLA